MISRLLLILALAVLAYIVYITMTASEKFANKATKLSSSIESLNNTVSSTTETSKRQDKLAASIQNNMNKEQDIIRRSPKNDTFDNQINYETFADAPGPVEVVPNVRPASFKDNKPEDDGLYATVNYTGLVDTNPNDSLQIEGTDLLTAPLVDNMLYTNSISNVNRNASQDLRGDISVQFDKNYTPFYTSTIAGVDRLGGTMNIGRIPMTVPAVAV